MSTIKKQRVFTDSWLSEDCFKHWLRKDKDEKKAICAVCKKVIELSSSGRSALTDHHKGKKHQEALQKVTNFFKY